MNQSEKIHKTNQYKFKICVYYSHREDGTAYSEHEVRNKMNRKYHSFSDKIAQANKSASGAILPGGWMITNEEKSMLKLVNMCKNNTQRLYKALLIMNDWENNLEITIAKFYGGELFQNVSFIYPVFSKPDEKGNVFVLGLPEDCEPLRTDEMREQNLLYSQEKNKRYSDYKNRGKSPLEREADQWLRKK